MSSLQYDLGDAGMLRGLTRINLIDPQFDQISLIEHDVVEVKVLPTPSIGKMKACDRLFVYEKGHCSHTRIAPEFLKRPDYPVGDPDPVEGSITTIGRKLFWNPKLDDLTWSGDGGNPRSRCVIIAEFRGRLK